ncbi:hypothetical protein BpHYR1_038054 [Brachionus plicatilis]|uniref:EF-hand domain-containing protein n=1 Tax=Brachionus plicatilis TaxID=10195 RepID=A0A3M7P3R1_BRAPC|nr:hypothetical protein BpHYR1_038054 [Brachionus plicatilis]
MNFEEINKKYFNPSEDEDSLASTTSDVSFTMTKKEVKVETKAFDSDNFSELVKSMEKHEEIKLDDSLIDKANEIYSYMKDTSESSNPNDSEKGQDEKSLDLSLNDSELKKVADNLESSQLDESINESENDSDLKEIVKNLEAAINENFNEENLKKTDSVLNEIQSENFEAKDNLAKIVEDMVAPLSSLGNENLSKITSEMIQSGEPSDEWVQQETEQKEESKAEESADKEDQESKPSEPEAKEVYEAEQSFGELNASVESNEANKSEESQGALSQIMQFVTGLTTLGSSGGNARETESKNEEFTDIVKEIQNDLNSSQALESTESQSIPDNADDSQKSEPNQANESVNEESQQSVADDNQQSELDASQISNIEEEVKELECEEKVTVEVSQSEPEKDESQKDELKQEVDQKEEVNELKQEVEHVKFDEADQEQRVEARTEQLDNELKEFVNQVAQELSPSEPSQDFEINISERITMLAQELIKEPELTEKVEADGEVRSISENGIEAVACTLFSPDDILFRKEEIMNKYKISEEQFDLCRQFFNEKKEGSLLSNNVVRVLMREALKKRAQVKAEDADIDRALEVVDEDKDDKVTFDELIQFLLLFFSSKTNVENRIGNILKAKLSSETLSANEAVQFAGFLNKFYGHPTDGEEFKEDLNLSDFLKDILPSLGSLAFVQPEEPNEESSDQKEEQEEKKEQEHQEEQEEKQETTEQSNVEANRSIEAVEA